MQEWEEKLTIYIKAGFSKKDIISKLTKKFDGVDIQHVSDIFDSYYQEKNSKNKELHGLIIPIILVVVLVMGYIVYNQIIEYNSFSSSKCFGSTPISIDGSRLFREKVIQGLQLIEDTNCEYMRFVEEYSPHIQEGVSGLFVGGQYEANDTNLPEVHLESFISGKYVVAYILIHEACHGFQHNEGASYAEDVASKTTFDFLQTINAPSEYLTAIKTVGETHPAYAFNDSTPDCFLQWLQKKSR